MSGSTHGAPPVLVVTGAHPKLYNHDLAPTAPEGLRRAASGAVAIGLALLGA